MMLLQLCWEIKVELQPVVKVTHKIPYLYNAMPKKMNLVLKTSIDNIRKYTIFFSAISVLSYFRSSIRSFALAQEVEKDFSQ